MGGGFVGILVRFSIFTIAQYLPYKPVESPLHEKEREKYPNSVIYKAAPRFELGVKDLQSSALPLGYAAFYSLV
jgi:hypothetical protein